jgi:hypothetical protein
VHNDVKESSNFNNGLNHPSYTSSLPHPTNNAFPTTGVQTLCQPFGYALHRLPGTPPVQPSHSLLFAPPRVSGDSILSLKSEETFKYIALWLVFFAAHFEY